MNQKAAVLIVDDEPKNRELLGDLASSAGHEALLAASGEEALSLLARREVDLVLLDAMMPGLSGFEVLRRMRADPRLRLIPVVMVSALSDLQDRIQGIEAGCDDFLPKPCSTVEVLARMGTCLRLSYYRRQLDEKKKFQAVVEAMGDGVIVLDPDWRVSALNPAAGDCLEFPREAHPHFLDLIFGKYAVSIPREALADLSCPRKTFDIVREATDRFKPLVLEARLDALRDSEGRVSSIVVALRNATDERMEEWAKRDFISFVSHKMNTPMTVISGYAALLAGDESGPLTKSQKSLIQGILKHARRVSDMVRSVTRYSSAEIAASREEKAVLELSSYLPDLVRPLAEAVKDRKVELSLDMPRGGAFVSIHKSFLDFMIESLVENAIKFCDKDVARIGVSLKCSFDKVLVTVSDNGPGIPGEEKAKVLRGFYQVEKDFTGEVGGLGLGLSLASRIARLCGGTLSLDSKIGEGASVRLELNRLSECPEGKAHEQ